MTTPFANSLDVLSGWRASLANALDGLSRYLAEQDLADPATAVALDALRRRLESEKLVVAFVAEFSRGKSELINAIFFADSGRRVLPATPGRTTMCPVELAWDDEEGASLLLLPIETRLEGLSLAELRPQRRAWRSVALEMQHPDRLAESFQEVTRTKWVDVDTARQLGFWDDERPDDNPPTDAAGQVEIPAWRHALINYPHPLLKQGLVVVDTPGLNAIGAEPELTLSLLPSAHATVFILAADSGVTRSDLGVWRDHLDTHALSRFVVLNKIDALVDPLATRQQVDAQIALQCAETARTLGVPMDRVFPLSARQALAARIAGDDAQLQSSRLPRLEEAIGAQLLPQRRAVLERVVVEGTQEVEQQVARRITDLRRQIAEQTLELRGLRGKSGGKLRLMIQRIEAETDEFEQCASHLQAMRTVHTRMVRDALVYLTSERLRDEVQVMQKQMGQSLLHLGARKAFLALAERLRVLLREAQKHSDEVRDMLAAAFAKLNGEYGFSLTMTAAPNLTRFVGELDEIAASYGRYLGLSQAVRLAQPKFMEQFRRMLLSKLRVVFENATAEIELWNRATSSQVDGQLRDQRRTFRHRRDSLERVQTAASDLEARITELEAQDRHAQAQLQRLRQLCGGLREQAAADAAVVARAAVEPTGAEPSAKAAVPAVAVAAATAVTTESREAQGYVAA